MRERAASFSHITACLALVLPAFLLCPGVALCAEKAPQERSTYRIGETPAGQPVFVTHYHRPDDRHWYGLWEVYIGERALPDSHADIFCSTPALQTNTGRAGGFLHRECRKDAALDPYLSPDGATLYLNFEDCEIGTGNNIFTTRVFAWSEKEGSYLPQQQFSETLLQKNVRLIHESLVRGNFHATLQCMRGLTMAGRDGFCVHYPPDELLLPLWRACWHAALRENTAGRSGAALVMLFLQTAVITSADDEFSDPADASADDEFMDTLALFLAATADNPAALHYMEKCLSLLKDDEEFRPVSDAALAVLAQTARKAGSGARP